MNPNEAAFQGENVRKKVTRERSDIIKRLCGDLENTANKSESRLEKDHEKSQSISK